MRTRWIRPATRIVHLAAGLTLGLLVYLPASMSGGLKAVLMVAGIPVIVLTGAWLWQQGRIRRWLRRRRPEPAERVPR